jgi:putative sigma-54 modulation protein
MISSVDITGVKYNVNDATRRYVLRKVAKLDRYLPKHARKSVAADIKLKLVNRDHGNKYEAEVILTVPDKRILAKDSTFNMMAAIDIVEAKLIAQLRKYKQSTVAHVGRRRLLGRAKQIREATPEF